MSQERWDVVVKFTEGPLSFQGDIVCRGPVVRMGANPGPGGLKLEGYRALDDRQAVIQSYDGGTVSIAPVGTNQVRVAPYENVDWGEYPPIRGPVYLSPGAAVHLGPPGRGVTLLFVESRRLGVWEQGQILSESKLAESSQIKELEVDRGRPAWFIPAMVMIGVSTAVAVLIWLIKPPEIPPLGPVEEGQEYYTFVTQTEPLDPRLAEGLNAPFYAFVMAPNADAAGMPELKQVGQWDQRFYEYVSRSAQAHARAWKFWQRLEQVREHYGYVVKELRDNGLPEVFAGIPYQESRYNPNSQSYVCARGWWQFMPEVAHRVGIKVQNCKLRGSAEPWSPTGMIVPKQDKRVYFDASTNSCRIQDCAVDEREDLQATTRGAVKLLAEAFMDEELRTTGSVVQMSILSHNMGYDDSRYNPDRRSGVKWAWKRYSEAKKLEKAPDFYGQNILCTDPKAPPDEKCGSVMWKETQHYAYNIVAQHMLAVCYYARNYSEEAAFAPWKEYDRGDGYCTRTFQVPSTQEVLAKGGGGGR